MYRVILLIFITFAALVAQAAVHEKKIEIDSDELKYYTEENVAMFTGNVYVVYGDVKLYSNACTVQFEKNSAKANTEDGKATSVKSIKLTGNVRIVTPKEHIESSSGFYDTKLGTITMTGSVKLTQDKNVLYGDKLVHNIKTGESVLSSEGKKRVKAVIIPEDKL